VLVGLPIQFHAKLRYWSPMSVEVVGGGLSVEVVGGGYPWAVDLSPPFSVQSSAGPLTSSEKAKNDRLALRGLVIRPGFGSSAVNVMV